MPRLLIHVPVDCDKVKQCIQQQQQQQQQQKSLQVRDLLPIPNVLDVQADTQTQLDDLETHLRKTCSSATLNLVYDHDHPKGGRGQWKRHSVIKPIQHRFTIDANNKQSGKSTSVSPEAIPLPPPGFFYGSTLANVYRFPKPDPSKTHHIAIVSLGGIFFKGSAAKYWRVTGVSPAPTFSRIVKVDGTILVSIPESDLENMLDVEMAGSACPGATIVVYASVNSNMGYIDAVISALKSKKFVPDVVSSSWGSAEPFVDSGSVALMNVVLQYATDAGVNVTVATGDQAAGCAISDGLPHIQWPASSPFCVACGGTTLVCPSGVYSASTSRETAWSFSLQANNGGTGGVSTLYPKPSYQAALFPQFKGRMVPDISMDANPATGVIVLILGNAYIVGGTSAVAPLMAGYIAATKPGHFITPLLYSPTVQPAFHPITSGTNGRYRCAPGYNLVTGWGSFDGQKLASRLSKAL